ncbi:hypothetical protein FACS1894191_5430 [Clostridia bacterium]|nr:hypothetical protein FACS1894191_5430 [Clostridia bacterium]
MPKKYRLEILAPAQLELEEIAGMRRELAGAKSARKLTDSIYNSLEHLRIHPLMGAEAKIPALNEQGYRVLISGEHLCFYRPIGDVIYVYHIVHGASDYPKMLHDLL